MRGFLFRSLSVLSIIHVVLEYKGGKIVSCVSASVRSVKDPADLPGRQQIERKVDSLKFLWGLENGNDTPKRRMAIPKCDRKL